MSKLNICFGFYIFSEKGVGILPMVLIALNNCQSANSNLQQQQQANFLQDGNLFLRFSSRQQSFCQGGNLSLRPEDERR